MEWAYNVSFRIVHFVGFLPASQKYYSLRKGDRVQDTQISVPAWRDLEPAQLVVALTFHICQCLKINVRIDAS